MKSSLISVPSLAANVAENSILFAAYGVCQTFVAQGLGVAKTEDLSTGLYLSLKLFMLTE